MNICFVGAGYVGLVSGACLADFGHHVICVDKDRKKIEALIEGEMPIYEPGLDRLVEKNVGDGRLRFTTNLKEAIVDSRVIFIAVGTPKSRRGDGAADLGFVYGVAREIAPHLITHKTVVTKSTVPVGTARQIERIIFEINPQAKFAVASNPEFLREGAAIEDFKRPDRVVLGVDGACVEAVEDLRDVYSPLYLNGAPIEVTDLETAELSKYASNAFLAMKISFINEMANLCDEMGANVQDLSRVVGLDGRIGSKFLHPGPGYGGSCFPKDTEALRRIAHEAGVPMRTVAATIEANEAQKALMIKKISDTLGGSVEGCAIAVLGLTFKPETDDMREAASLTILPALADKGAVFRLHDPQGMEEAREAGLSGDAYTFVDDAYKACEGTDAVVILTEWNQYRSLELKRIRKSMVDSLYAPAFVDLRNIYDHEDVISAGFKKYVSLGKK